MGPKLNMSGMCIRLMRKIRYRYTSLKIVPDEFESDFYESQVEIQFSDRQSAWTHYVCFGAPRNYSPCHDFSPVYYLEKYQDVRKACIEPFSHFLQHGKVEGRNSAPLVVLPFSDDVDEYHHNSDKQLSGPDRFNINLLKRQGVESFEEYLQRDGAKGDAFSMLRPVSWFEPIQYYALNPDVRDARIDAYSHFLATGYDEGRSHSFPLLRSVDHIMSLDSLASRKEKWQSFAKSKPVLVDYLDEIVERIRNKIVNQDIQVFICSDDPLANVGGVQRVIKEKVAVSDDNKNICLLVIPLFPSPTHETGSTFLELKINHERIGIIDSNALVDFIGIIESYAKQFEIEIHGILGVDLNTVCELINAYSGVSKFIVHDFTLLCGNPALTWNQLEWCDAPETASDRCSTCIYGEERLRSESLRKNLIEKIGSSGVDVLVPSVFAKNYVKAKIGLNSKVVPHGEIKFTGSRRRTKETIKVAFVGLPVVAKGWNEFVEFYLTNCHDERIEFLHIGSIQSQFDYIPFAEFSDLKSNELSGFLVDQNVDFVFLFPRGSETFSFVTFESIAAGCYLLSDCVSAQITQVGLDYGRLISFSNIDELVDMGIDGTTFEYLSSFNVENEFGRFISREKLDLKHD